MPKDTVEIPEGFDRNKTVFVVDPPADGGSKFILLVSQGSSYGGSRVAFAVDALYCENDTSGRAYEMKARRGDEIITQFPIGTNYLLVKRSLIRAITAMEATTEQLEEEVVLRRIQDRYQLDIRLGDPDKTAVPSGHYL